MALGFASLVLTPFPEQERLLLVRATDALRLCRDGSFATLPRHQAEARLMQVAGRVRTRLREFIQQVRLTALPLARCNDTELLRLVQSSVKSADLVVIRECARVEPSEDSSLLQQRRLVRAIPTGPRHGLDHEGRRYRLVADMDLGRVPDREHYEVVGQAEAVAVLTALAAQAEPTLAGLLAQARDRLTRDWRPPLLPDGLILLRRARQVGAARPEPERLRQPSKPRSEPEAPGETVEPATVAADIDQASQVTTLLEAARDGVAFCEECEAG